MQMIPGTYPGASHEPDHVPLFHLRTFPGVNECQMCVSGLKSETVRNDYRFPISGRFTCERHRPTGCGVYGSRYVKKYQVGNMWTILLNEKIANAILIAVCDFSK